MSRLDVAAALEAEGMTISLAVAVAQLMGETGLGGLQGQIVTAARAMTTIGVPFDVQHRVFMRAFGVGIGGGGGQGGGGPRVDPCPWCAGTGSHGGSCPGPWLGYGPGPHYGTRPPG